MIKISVLVPVLNRPKNVRPLIESFLANSSGSSDIVFIVQDGDSAEMHAVGDAILYYTETAKTSLVRAITVPAHRTRWSHKLNSAHRMMRHDVLSDKNAVLDDLSDWYLLGADDLRFHKGWDNHPSLITLMKNPAVGVIGTNDLGNPAVIAGRHSTHPLIRRSYVEERGIMEAADIVVPECYHHNFPDTEIVSIAKTRKAYAHCFDSVVEHLHPAWNKAEKDDVYKLGDKHYAVDHALYQARKRFYGWA
jgi:hypothetical protein